MRLVFVLFVVASVACGRASDSNTATAEPAAGTTPRDAQHQGVTGPHGDHTPHHGGLVLMNGDVHYEIVLGGDGRHQIWFSDAMRNELPASVAADVSLEVARPGADPEPVALAIDETGEAWVGKGRPVESADGVMVKVRHTLRGEAPHEIELPFVAPTTP